MARKRKRTADIFCPRCDARVNVSLGPDEVCPECETTNAWARYGEGGSRLRIDRAAIEQSIARRSVRKLPIGTRAVPCIIAFLLGMAAVVAMTRISGARAIGPLDELVTQMRETARLSLWLGVAAFLAGIVAAILLLRSRLFRAWALTGLSVIAVGTGLVAAVVGGLNVAADIGWKHLSMPPLSGAVVALPGIRRVMSATAVVVAPDADGDASRPAIGTGAIIHSEKMRAWIVTCSHVAMPYAAVASFRDASQAHPVWVYFSDGRNVEGRVAWTAQPPLDVALIAVDIKDPPPAVTVSRSAEDTRGGTEVLFVPNPFRDGWLQHRGTVSARRAHLTPAGQFSLVLTDLPLQPGDSGSGLFDTQNRLIGLNTWRVGNEDRTWLGISLPSDTMKKITDMIERGDLSALEQPR